MSRNEENNQEEIENQALDKIALALILVAKRILAEEEVQNKNE